MNASYYAIIPANVRYDKDLSASAKLLYGEITALCNQEGYCWARNRYFSDIYNVDSRTVQRWIKQLCDKGYIHSSVVFKKDSKEVAERYITIVEGKNSIENNELSDKKITTPSDKMHHKGKNVTSADIKKNTTPHVENVTHNNTGFNNTGFNNKDLKKTKNNKNKEIKEKNTKKEMESQFEVLWKLYPRKQGSKKKALDSYTKAIKNNSTTFEQVMFGLESYIKYIEYHQTEEQFIKHGATWFNQESWNNDYTLKPKQISGKRHGAMGLLFNKLEAERFGVQGEEWQDGTNRNTQTFSDVYGNISEPL